MTERGGLLLGVDVGLYDDLYKVYRDLCSATREQVHKLSGMQKGGGDVVT